MYEQMPKEVTDPQAEMERAMNATIKKLTAQRITIAKLEEEIAMRDRQIGELNSLLMNHAERLQVEVNEVVNQLERPIT